MQDIIIVNPEELERKIKEFKKGGAEKLHVLSDFDKTITTFILPNGEQMPSLISRIRNGPYLSKEYSKKANELYNKYHPIEIDANISMSEKKKMMYEWWYEHFKLLGESGLNKKIVEKVAKDLIDGEKIALRKGAREFFRILKNNKIPLVIISSSVGDLIKSFLSQEKILDKNMHIIANILSYDKQGNFKEVEHIVHVFNKDESVLEEFPNVFKEIKTRKNVLLLGDSLGDLGMIEGFNYDGIIKIGFLNENVEEQLEVYKKFFDVIILNDGSFDYVNELIGRILI
ncbi:hypothetical protein HYW74_01405 [Candidatus Pacearchaeota archaeon]|nr:hypothetical protein [Candidatus Pacearchaeota archaeon]